MTWTTPLCSNASLYELAPARSDKRGRPRLKGKKLASLATGIQFAPTTVTCYGTTATVSTAVLGCLWYGVFGPQQVQVVFVRDKSKNGYDIALVTTDLARRPGHRTLRGALVDRGCDRRREAARRRRAGPQPPTRRCRTYRPVRTHHQHARRLLVRDRWVPPRRRPSGTTVGPLVPAEGPALGPRHARQAPPCHHRRAISARRPPAAHRRGNLHPAPGLGGRRCVGEKVESPRSSSNLTMRPHAAQA